MMHRIAALDSARGVAVVLAILSHCFIQFSVENHASIVTRTATPTFLILFGVMIEFLYLRTIRTGGSRRSINRRFLRRSVTCYLIFASLTLVAFLTAKIDALSTAQALLYMGPGRFGVILKVYAVLFIIVMFLIPFAQKWGSSAFVGVALAGWAIKYALDDSSVLDAFFFDFIFGHVSGGFGPSILPSFTLISFGVMIGEAISGQRGWFMVSAIGIAAALLLVAAGWSNGLSNLYENIVNFRYRGADHPLYYAFGICGAIITLLTCRLAWRGGSAGYIPRALAVIGQETLFVYGFGNVAINALPTYHGSPWAGLALSILFMTILLALTFDRASSTSWMDYLSRGYLTRFSVIYSRLSGRLIDMVLPEQGAAKVAPRMRTETSKGSSDNAPHHPRHRVTSE